MAETYGSERAGTRGVRRVARTDRRRQSRERRYGDKQNLQHAWTACAFCPAQFDVRVRDWWRRVINWIPTLRPPTGPNAKPTMTRTPTTRATKNDGNHQTGDTTVFTAAGWFPETGAQSIPLRPAIQYMPLDSTGRPMGVVACLASPWGRASGTMINDEFPKRCSPMVTGTGSVDALAEALGVQFSVPRALDWRRLGMALPADYRRLAEEFPVGWFQGFAGLHYPGVSLTWHHFDLEARRDESSGLLRDLQRRGLEIPFPVYPEPGGLFEWGSSRWGDSFFWITDGADPELWKVAASEATHASWRVFDGGVGDFLLGLVCENLWSGFFTSDVAFGEPRWEPVEVDIWVDLPSPLLPMDSADMERQRGDFAP